MVYTYYIYDKIIKHVIHMIVSIYLYSENNSLIMALYHIRICWKNKVSNHLHNIISIIITS